MPIKVERKVIRAGDNSCAIILPKAWVDYKGIKCGDVVEIIVNDDITIRPKTIADTKS